MTKISDLVALLRAIEMEKGDIPVKYLSAINPYGDPEYEDIEICEYCGTQNCSAEAGSADEEDPDVNGFVVIE